MIGMIKNLTKAVVSAALTPVAVVADIATIPASAYRNEEHPFQRTGSLLNEAGKNINKVIDPED